MQDFCYGSCSDTIYTFKASLDGSGMDVIAL